MSYWLMRCYCWLRRTFLATRCAASSGDLSWSTRCCGGGVINDFTDLYTVLTRMHVGCRAKHDTQPHLRNVCLRPLLACSIWACSSPAFTAALKVVKALTNSSALSTSTLGLHLASPIVQLTYFNPTHTLPASIWNHRGLMRLGASICLCSPVALSLTLRYSWRRWVYHPTSFGLD